MKKVLLSILMLSPAFGFAANYFTENKGQLLTTDGKPAPAVQFYYRTGGQQIFFFADHLEYVLETHSRLPRQLMAGELADERIKGARLSSGRKVIVYFENCNKGIRLEASGRQAGVSNYFYGKLAVTGVGQFNTLTYPNLYPGIDLIFTLKNGQLKSTYYLSAGADPGAIVQRYSGAIEQLQLTSDGSLQAVTKTGIVSESYPISFQVGKQIPTNYVLNGRSLSFNLASYNHSKPLEIDPVVAFYSSYLGGTEADEVQKVNSVNLSEVYLMGNTTSTNFPVQNAWDNQLDSADDVFVTKINTTNNSIYYSTYVGGHSQDYPLDMDVNNHQVIVGGTTISPNFPITAGSIDTSFNGMFDGFIFKLAANGQSLVFSTYIGGTGIDRLYSVAAEPNPTPDIDFGGMTLSTDLPATANAFDTSANGNLDGFLGKMNPSGNNLAMLTYIGGSDWDEINAVDLVPDPIGQFNIGFLGRSMSTNFPLQNALYTTNNGGSGDAVIGIMSIGNLPYSTYYGGTGTERATAIKLAPDSNFYCTGYTTDASFPMVSPFQSFQGGSSDAYIIKINPWTNVVNFSSCLGSNGGDQGMDIAPTINGGFHVTGFTNGSNLPCYNSVFTTFQGGLADIMVAGFLPNNQLEYCTYFGGKEEDGGYGIDYVDSAGRIIFCGYSRYYGYPMQYAYDTSFSGLSEGVFTILGDNVTQPGIGKVSTKTLDAWHKGNEIIVTMPPTLLHHTLHLYAADGKLILSIPIFSQQHSIETDGLARGIYCLRAGEYTGKVMVR